MKLRWGWGVVLLAAVGCESSVVPTKATQTTKATMTEARVEAAVPARTPDVIYVPTAEPVVQGMLKLAGVGKNDTVYDLGCGDGRIVIEAARKYGARGVGVDIDPERVKEARQNVKEAKVADKVDIRQGDLFETNLSKASVVTLYLLPSLNEKLRPKLLRELAPGSRIVSHGFEMGDWKPDATAEVDGTRIFLWTVPGAAAPAGR